MWTWRSTVVTHHEQLRLMCSAEKVAPEVVTAELRSSDIQGRTGSPDPFSSAIRSLLWWTAPGRARGSGRLASSSARARALKVASARWWSFSPASRRTCRPIARRWRTSGAGAGSSRWQAADRRPLERQVDAGPASAAEVDGHQCQRFVERHHGIAKAADPAPLAQRRSNAWPSVMPTSSAVWCWSTCRSPSARRVRSKRECRARLSSM